MISSEVRRLLVVAAVAAAAFFGVFGFAVGTELGQRADDAALVGSEAAPERAESAADNLLRVVSIGSLLAAIAVLSGLAWLRRRPGLLLVPGAVIGASLIATELFKLVILQRPELIVESKFPDNTYPSGHATVAIAIGMAALAIAPTRLRARVGIAAALLAAAGGVFVVTAEWHRPSDPIGSFTLTLAVTALVLAGLRIWRQRRGEEPRTLQMSLPASGSPAARVELTTLLVGATLFVGSGVIASLRYGSEVDWNRANVAFLLSAAVIVIAAGLCVGALLRALNSSPERREGPLS